MSFETDLNKSFLNKYGPKGVFETLLLKRRDNKSNSLASFGTTSFSAHYARLKAGCQAYRLSCISELKLKKLISKTYSNQVLDGSNYCLRIIWSKDGLITELSPYVEVDTSFVRAVTFKGSRADPLIKSLDASLSLEARSFAVKHRGYEALLVDDEGYLREGAWSNIFYFLRGHGWITPRDKILKGVTRGEMIEFLKNKTIALIEKDLILNEIRDNIQSAFICNSLIGAIPLSQIDQIVLDLNLSEQDICSKFNYYKSELLESIC